MTTFREDLALMGDTRPEFASTVWWILWLDVWTRLGIAYQMNRLSIESFHEFISEEW